MLAMLPLLTVSTPGLPPSIRSKAYTEPMPRIQPTTIFILMESVVFFSMKMGKMPQYQSAAALMVECAYDEMAICKPLKQKPGVSGSQNL